LGSYNYNYSPPATTYSPYGAYNPYAQGGTAGSNTSPFPSGPTPEEIDSQRQQATQSYQQFKNSIPQAQKSMNTQLAMSGYAAQTAVLDGATTFLNQGSNMMAQGTQAMINKGKNLATGAQNSLVNEGNCRRASYFLLTLDPDIMASLDNYANATLNSSGAPSQSYQTKYQYVLAQTGCNVTKFCTATCEGNDWKEAVFGVVKKPRLSFLKGYNEKMNKYMEQKTARKGNYCSKPLGGYACLNLCPLDVIPSCIQKASTGGIMNSYMIQLNTIAQLETAIQKGNSTAAGSLYAALMPTTYRAPIAQPIPAEVSQVASFIFPAALPVSSAPIDLAPTDPSLGGAAPTSQTGSPVPATTQKAPMAAF
jgi:hypothetical protein